MSASFFYLTLFSFHSRLRYPGSQTHANLHVHADITLQPIRLEVSTSLGVRRCAVLSVDFSNGCFLQVSSCVLTMPIGETLQPTAMSLEEFDKSRGTSARLSFSRCLVTCNFHSHADHEFVRCLGLMTMHLPSP